MYVQNLTSKCLLFFELSCSQTNTHTHIHTYAHTYTHTNQDDYITSAIIVIPCNMLRYALNTDYYNWNSFASIVIISTLRKSLRNVPAVVRLSSFTFSSGSIVRCSVKKQKDQRINQLVQDAFLEE